jgi:hypothetical protein
MTRGCSGEQQVRSGQRIDVHIATPKNVGACGSSGEARRALVHGVRVGLTDGDLDIWSLLIAAAGVLTTCSGRSGVR